MSTTSSVTGSTISFGGLATGLPANIVDQLMQVEQQRLTSLQKKKAEVTSQQSALSDLGSKLSALDSAVTSLQSSTTWSPHTAVSSATDYVGISADSTAVAGSHTVEVSRLANSQMLMSAAGVTSSSDTLTATPTLAFTLYSTDGSTSHNYTASDFGIAAGDTLANIASKISSYDYDNDITSSGVSASVLYDGTNYRLVLSPKDSGAAARNADGTTKTTRMTNLSIVASWTGGASWDTSATSGNTLVISSSSNAMTSSTATTAGTTTTADLQFSFDSTAYTLSDFGYTNATLQAGVTLSDIADAINTKVASTAALTGLKASVVNDGYENKLILDSSSTTKLISAFTSSLSFSNGGGTGVASLMSSSSWNAVQTGLGLDAKMKVDGLSNIYSSSNSVTNVLSGVTMTLKQVTSSAVSLTIANDRDTLKTTLNSFTSAFNDVIKYVTDNSAKGGSLEGSSLARSIISQMRAQLNTSTSAGDGTGSVLSPFSMLAEMGLRTDQKTGQISFDTTKLDTALTTNFTNLSSLFTNTQTAVGTGHNAGLAYRLDTALQGITASSTGSLAGAKASVTARLKLLEATIEREQDREDRVRAQLNKKFSSLEQMVSSLNSQGSALTAALAKM
ncbi:MAG: flagellar filament capping protein FliD [Magnetococcales bacterium]|nr:flagellar filament capping protein FliD [Magnetococcales bacterium]